MGGSCAALWLVAAGTLGAVLETDPPDDKSRGRAAGQLLAGCIPEPTGLRANYLWTRWDRDLGLDGGAGVDLAVVWGKRRIGEAGPDWLERVEPEGKRPVAVIGRPGPTAEEPPGPWITGGVELGVRFEWADDERTDADVSAWTLYFAIAMHRVWPMGLGVGGSLSVGVSAFSLDDAAVQPEQDSGTSVSLSFPQLGWRLGTRFLIEIVPTWGLTRTDFNSDRTRTMHNFSVGFSVTWAY